MPPREDRDTMRCELMFNIPCRYTEMVRFDFQEALLAAPTIVEMIITQQWSQGVGAKLICRVNLSELSLDQTNPPLRLPASQK